MRNCYSTYGKTDKAKRHLRLIIHQQNVLIKISFNDYINSTLFKLKEPIYQNILFPGFKNLFVGLLLFMKGLNKPEGS